MVSDYPLIYRVEDLIKEIYKHFCRSPKRFREFQQFAEGLTNGRKLLKDNDTKWISLDGLAHQVFSKYPSLLGTMESIHDNHSGQWKYGDLLEKLSNIETLLTLVPILSMLEEMRNNMKKIQKRYMYISEYNMIHKMT